MKSSVITDRKPLPESDLFLITRDLMADAVVKAVAAK